MFEEIINKIKKAQNIVIFPHTNIDGDGVGCAKALALFLKKIGKNAFIYCDEIIPSHVSFLESDDFIIKGTGKTPDWLIPDNYLAFAVDCSDIQRIDNRIDEWNNAYDRVCIDHHPGKDGFAESIVRNVDAPAAALLIFEFIEEYDSSILDIQISEAIYTGILTDTGAFKYSNTDSHTHIVVAKLLEYGIDHSHISNLVFDNKPLEQLEIEAYSLQNSEIFEDGRAVISVIPYDYWSKKGVAYSYCDSSVDILRSIRGVELAALLKEEKPGTVKLSLRSKDYAEVSVIASRLGGGGHKKAAGATLSMSNEEAIALVKNEIHLLLKECRE